MADTEAPVILAFQPPASSADLSRIATITCRVTDGGDPTEFLDAATLDVSVSEKALGATVYGAPVLVISGSVPVVSAGWEKSRVVALVSGEQEIAVGAGDSSEFYVVMEKDALHSFGMTYQIDITVADKVANTTTTTFFYQIELDPRYGFDTTTTLTTNLLQDQFAIPFVTTAYENLRQELLNAAASSNKVGNWEDRVSYRLIQALERAGRVSFLQLFWGVDLSGFDSHVAYSYPLSDVQKTLRTKGKIVRTAYDTLVSTNRISSDTIAYINREAEAAGVFKELAFAILVMFTILKLRSESSAAIQ